MPRIYLIYPKPYRFPQLWFISLSKIGFVVAAGSKNKYLVEIVGTFILVYAICSAATVYSTNVRQGIAGLGQLAMIGVGLVHALVLTAIVYAIGYRSLNPRLIQLLQ
jgi:hypothetical protein